MSQGMYAALGAISPQWGKLQQKYGGAAPADATGEFGPTDEEDGMLKALSAQTIQPYKSGWGALPGVAASIVGGLASRQLRENAQQRQGIDSASFGQWVKQVTGTAPQVLPAATQAAAAPPAPARQSQPAQPQFTPQPQMQSAPEQRPAIAGGAGSAPMPANDRPAVGAGGDTITQERINAASPGMPQPPQNMPAAAQPAPQNHIVPQQQPQQPAAIPNRLAAAIDGQLSQLNQEKASLAPMLANPRLRQTAMHRLDQLEQRRFQLEQHRMQIDDPAKQMALQAAELDLKMKQREYDTPKDTLQKLKEDEALYRVNPRTGAYEKIAGGAAGGDGTQSSEFRKAYDKERGDAFAKAQQGFPVAHDNAMLALDTLAQLEAHPGRSWATGAYGSLPTIPGTDARGFANLLDQAKGKTFLEAFNSLRGGGAITESEGGRATQALARLDRAQTEQDFNAAIADLRTVIGLGLQRNRAMATAPAGAPPQVQQQTGLPQPQQGGQEQPGQQPQRMHPAQQYLRSLPDGAYVDGATVGHPGVTFQKIGGQLHEAPAVRPNGTMGR